MELTMLFGSGWNQKRRERERKRTEVEQQIQAFRSVGTAMGLTATRWRDGTEVVEGDKDGRHIRYLWRSGGEHPGPAALVSYAGGPLGVKLRIKRRTNRWQKTAVTVGDESFDGLMLVKTSQPDRVALVLDAKTRRQILDLAFDGRFEIKDSRILFYQPTKANQNPPSGQFFSNLIQALVAVAEALESIRSPH